MFRRAATSHGRKRVAMGKKWENEKIVLRPCFLPASLSQLISEVAESRGIEEGQLVTEAVRQYLQSLPNFISRGQHREREQLLLNRHANLKLHTIHIPEELDEKIKNVAHHHHVDEDRLVARALYTYLRGVVFQTSSQFSPQPV